MIEKFNIRVYGLLKNQGRLLVLKEPFQGKQILKFPGGGLELGEGLSDCLKREFAEELNLEITHTEHFYTQDDFFPSRFRENEQLMLIYFLVQIKNIKSMKKLDHDIEEILWLNIDESLIGKLSLPMDKLVARMILT